MSNVSLKIVADGAIPGVQAAFAELGQVALFAGHAICPAHVRDADLLVVRTVTPVNEALLSGSRVRFVASPTSGSDHVDRDFLAAAGIAFAHAPGCNARPVAEYVLSSLFALGEMRDFNPWVQRIGIVGCGHVGSRLMAFLDALGMEYLSCDPPLREATADGRYRDLHDLQGVDVLTLHVPLTDGGAHATRHLIGEDFLARVNDNFTLINAARGGVVDECALLQFLEGHDRACAVLDVWEGEPRINLDLLARTALATPHIAGYSMEARRRGLATVKRKAQEFFGLPGSGQLQEAPMRGLESIRLPAAEESETVRMAVLASYDVRGDAAQLQRLAGLPPAERGKYFTALRDRYPVRLEFPARPLQLPAPSPRLLHMLGGLGFTVTADTCA